MPIPPLSFMLPPIHILNLILNSGKIRGSGRSMMTPTMHIPMLFIDIRQVPLFRILIILPSIFLFPLDLIQPI